MFARALDVLLDMEAEGPTSGWDWGSRGWGRSGCPPETLSSEDSFTSPKTQRIEKKSSKTFMLDCNLQLSTQRRSDHKSLNLATLVAASYCGTMWGEDLPVLQIHLKIKAGCWNLDSAGSNRTMIPNASEPINYYSFHCVKILHKLLPCFYCKYERY